MNKPDYLGTTAYGIKMGVIVPGMELEKEIFSVMRKCSEDELLDNGDVLCITESIVARAQNNYVTVDDVSGEIKDKLALSAGSKLGVVFPITSRNRFSMILKGMAKSVNGGEVVIQLSFPDDEVGNQIIQPEYISEIGKTELDTICESELNGRECKHPITGVDYVALYKEIVAAENAKPTVIFSNDPSAVLSHSPDGVIAADIHTRFKTMAAIKKSFKNVITLQDICSEGESWSEWGVLGSNMSSGDKIKLAPREGYSLVASLQDMFIRELGKKMEVLIYGDGAYRDPSSGIYELADPQPVFASTGGLNCYREGIKYKYLADKMLNEGKSVGEIESLLKEKQCETIPQDIIESEGTTPRLVGDLLASLADLVSGSADAGTPLVLIKGFLKG